jgi:hypothetical protein
MYWNAYYIRTYIHTYVHTYIHYCLHRQNYSDVYNSVLFLSHRAFPKMRDYKLPDFRMFNNLHRILVDFSQCVPGDTTPHTHTHTHTHTHYGS